MDVCIREFECIVNVWMCVNVSGGVCCTYGVTCTPSSPQRQTLLRAD